MNLPEQLETRLSGYTWNQATIGMSTAATYRLECPDRSTMYLKVDRQSATRELAAEQEVLAWLAGRLPVPQVLYFGEEDSVDYLLMSGLSGLNAVDVAGAIPNAELVRLLARGLRMVHAVPTDNCPFDTSLDKKIELAGFNVKHNLVDEKDFDYVRHGRSPKELYGELLRLRPSTEDIVFTHGDYCLPNIIINEDRISGFIDLSRAGTADRYQDIALAIRSIGSNLGPGLDETFLSEYGIVEPDRKKIEYYMLLDEFF